MTRRLRDLVRTEQFWLGIIFLYYGMVNIAWLTADNVPPSFDQSIYLLRSFEFLRDVYRRDLAMFFQHFTSWDPHPPLLPLLAVPFHLVLGASFDSARFVNIPLILVLIVSIYSLSLHLTGDKVSSLVASFVAPSIPLIGTFSRYFEIDFLLVVVTVTSMLLLVRSDGFRARRYTALFAASFVVGLLTKELFWLFLLPPAAYVVVSRLRESTLLRQRILHRPGAVAVTILAAGLLAVALLRCCLTAVPFVLRSFGEGLFMLANGRYSAGEWIDYHNDFVGFGISYFNLFALIIVGIARFVSRTSRPASGNSPWRLLGLWFLIPYLFLSVAWNRDYRFAMPLMPVIAVAIACCASAIRNRLLRYAILTTVIIGGSLQFYAQAFGIGVLPTRVVLHMPTLDHVILFDQGYPGGSDAQFRDFPGGSDAYGSLYDGGSWRMRFSYVTHPDPSHWPIDEIVAYVSADAEEASGYSPPILYVVPFHPYFSSFNFEVQNVLVGVPVQVWPHRRETSLEAKIADVSSSDYLVTKTGLQGLPGRLLPYTSEILELLEGANLPFRRMETVFALPDGSVATVWRRE